MLRLVPVLLCLGLVGAYTATRVEEPKAVQKQEEKTAMLEMMDAMQQLMTGEKFDRVYYKELRDCMAVFDERLPASQDGAWQGVVDYWDMGGSKNDPWGASPGVYMEKNVTNCEFHNMTICEPCDYASNIAYYHDVTELCKRMASGSGFSMPEKYIISLGKAFSALAMGSSFMHGSNTKLGGQQDNLTIRVIAYLIHQASLESLPRSSTLHDLGTYDRPQSGHEIADEYLTMYLNMPVEDWYNHTAKIDCPDYYLTFGGIFSTALTIGFEPEFVDKYVPILAGMFGIPEDLLKFLTEQYIPELRTAISHVHLGPLQRAKFISKTVATIAKLVYAFLWQEDVLTDNPIFLSPELNELGWEFLPLFNEKVNKFSNFEYFEPDFQTGTDIYPGDSWCNPVIPHAKWHLESALGLLDLTYLGDEMHKIIAK